MLIYDGFKLFMMEKEVSCAVDTVAYYKLNLTKFLEYLSIFAEKDYKNMEYDFFNRESVIAYIAFLRMRVQYPGNDFIKVEKKLKNTSVNTYVRAIKIFANWSFEEGFLLENFSCKIKTPRDDNEQIIPLYQKDVDKIDCLFSSNCETSMRNLCIFHLMIDCGLRVGEVISLTIPNVMFEKNLINVLGKGSKYRIVPLPPKLKLLLYKYSVYYRSFSHGLEDRFFIQVKNQKPLTDSVIAQMFARIKNNTDINRVYPHLLRHTFATSYIMGGGNLEFLRILLGHYDYTVTRRYLHLASQYSIMHADIYKLDSIYFKSVY
ncbi:MAG: tyrosine-type recombinase/integrase [Clostridia bacterium]